jgi:hypothetical protein
MQRSIPGQTKSTIKSLASIITQDAIKNISAYSLKGDHALNDLNAYYTRILKSPKRKHIKFVKIMEALMIADELPMNINWHPALREIKNTYLAAVVRLHFMADLKHHVKNDTLDHFYTNNSYFDTYTLQNKIVGSKLYFMYSQYMKAMAILSGHEYAIYKVPNGLQQIPSFIKLNK